jgi:hypothetical protein
MPTRRSARNKIANARKIGLGRISQIGSRPLVRQALLAITKLIRQLPGVKELPRQKLFLAIAPFFRKINGHSKRPRNLRYNWQGFPAQAAPSSPSPFCTSDALHSFRARRKRTRGVWCPALIVAAMSTASHTLSDRKRHMQIHAPEIAASESRSRASLGSGCQPTTSQVVSFKPMFSSTSASTIPVVRSKSP